MAYVFVFHLNYDRMHSDCMLSIMICQTYSDLLLSSALCKQSGPDNRSLRHKKEWQQKDSQVMNYFTTIAENYSILPLK